MEGRVAQFAQRLQAAVGKLQQGSVREAQLVSEVRRPRTERASCHGTNVSCFVSESGHENTRSRDVYEGEETTWGRLEDCFGKKRTACSV